MYEATLDNRGVAELCVAKNKHGARGAVRLHFDGSTVTFRPVPEGRNPPPGYTPEETA